jgi:DNA polymerase I
MQTIGMTSVDYTVDRETGEPIIYLFGRDDRKRRVTVNVHGFQPYFYVRVPPEDVELLDENPVFESVEPEPYYAIRGEPVVRVNLKSPYDSRTARLKYLHYEADIPYATRFLIDRQIRTGITIPSHDCIAEEVVPTDVDIPYRTCILDIECISEDGTFPRPERDAIICVTCWDSYTKMYEVFYLAHGDETEISLRQGWTEGRDDIRIRVYPDEPALLQGLVGYIDQYDPDILTGWNFTGFDMPYIMTRMMTLGMDPMRLGRLGGRFNPKYCTVRGRAAFDLLAAYKKLTGGQRESFRLDAVAEEVLGEHKLHYTGTIQDLWRDDPAKLVHYNLKDVELCVGIDAKEHVMEFYQMLAGYVGCAIEDTLSNSRIVDRYLLRFGHGKYVFPSKPESAVEGKSFKGATVFQPVSGLYEWVGVFDLKSLYPMIMVTLNASPEMKADDGTLMAPNGVKFLASPDGLTRSIMMTLLTERDAMKAERKRYTEDDPRYHLLDLRQRVIKEIMNSYYGVSGYTKFRLYDQSFGSAVTSTGRAVIDHVKTVVESLGYTVLYGDTDSCMVQLPITSEAEALALGKQIEEVLNGTFGEFAATALYASTHTFSIKFEKLYRRFIQTGKKKRYAGTLIWKEGTVFKDKIDVAGFETKRSDSPKITREVQQEFLKLLVTGQPEREIKSYLRDIVRQYRQKAYSYDVIGVPSSFSKPLHQYEHPDAQVRGAMYANTHLGANFGAGSKPKRLYIKSVTGTYPRTDVLCFEYATDVPSEFVVDYELMLEKTLKNPIMRIAEEIGWSWHDIDPQLTTLASFGL